MIWNNYYTHKSYLGIITLSIDYINSSRISDEHHIALKNAIDFFEDDTNIGRSVIDNCIKILKKIINYDKYIFVYVIENKSIYFIVNDIIYQYFIKTYENDKLSGRLYRINIYNNEKFNYLYIKHDIRNLILTDINYLKKLITN
jgi:hypothetical protein